MSVLYVGIDVSKDYLDVAVWQQDQAQLLGQWPNQPDGFQGIVQALTQVVAAEQQLQVVLEPTGGYELAFVAFAHEQGWAVSLPNPKQVRDWAKGTGRRAKTDSLDALILAQYGAERQPRPQAELPEPLRQLEALLARQQDLQHMLRQERNRGHNLKVRPDQLVRVQASIERLIGLLEAELAEIEQLIAELIDQDPDLRAKLARIQQVPGIGDKNGPLLLLLLSRWHVLTQGQGTAKALTAHVGLDPQTYRSGTSVHLHQGISKMGNPHIRAKLYMGALGSVHAHNPLRDFYRRLVSRGKAKKLALVAAARKILTWAWVIFSRDVPFDPKKVDPNFV